MPLASRDGAAAAVATAPVPGDRPNDAGAHRMAGEYDGNIIEPRADAIEHTRKLGHRGRLRSVPAAHPEQRPPHLDPVTMDRPPDRPRERNHAQYGGLRRRDRHGAHRPPAVGHHDDPARDGLRAGHRWSSRSSWPSRRIWTAAMSTTCPDQVPGSTSTRDWEFLDAYAIPRALPVLRAGQSLARRVRLGPGRYVCGDHRDTPSIQGALVSGRRAASAVLADLHGSAAC
jgi:hypothetical protein